jgi:hypothetical protein
MEVHESGGNVRVYSSNNPPFCPFPVGFVMLLGNQSNPNTLFPCSTRKNLSEYFDTHVLAIGAVPGTIGGSNTLTFQAAILLNHSYKSCMNAPGGRWVTTITGTDNDGIYKRGFTSGIFTDEINGQSVTQALFNVENAFVQFCAWMRTAWPVKSESQVIDT